MSAPAARRLAAVPRSGRRVAIYTRKSTSKGLEDGVFSSLDAQRERCERYFADRPEEGWVVLNTHYDDGGYTGANTDRPAFQRMLKDIEAGKIDVLVAYRLDRLGRSLMDLVQLLAWLEERDVELVLVTERFDTTTVMGRAMLKLAGLLAEVERELIAERTRDKIQSARRRGIWTGGPVPLGYRSENKRLVIDEAEAVVVRRAFALYLEHHSADAVTSRLQEEGHRWRDGKPVRKANVRTLLRCVLVTGRIAAGEELVDGEHDAIISVADFEATQVLLKRRGRPQRRRRNHDYLLAGILHCARCGGAFTPATTTKRGTTYRYYRCVTRDKDGPEACAGGSLSAETVEGFVVTQLAGLAADPELVAQVSAALHQRVERQQAELRAEQRVLPQQVAALARQSDELVESMAGTSAQVRTAIERKLETVGAEHEAKASRLVDVEGQLIALERAETEAAWVAQALSRFEQVWAVMTPENRGRFVRALVQRVEVDEPSGVVEVRLTEVGGQLQEVE